MESIVKHVRIYSMWDKKFNRNDLLKIKKKINSLSISDSSRIFDRMYPIEEIAAILFLMFPRELTGYGLEYKFQK